MITRFAPSPTGPLHLGHAYSAMLAYDMAMSRNGVFLLRIEDIDQSRARPKWEAQIYDDLHWLGLRWPSPVMRQSDRLHSYRSAIERLWHDGLLYACHCTRADIAAATAAPQEGVPTLGPDGAIYPGTCRPLDGNRSPDPAPTDAALRLNIGMVACRLGTTPVLSFTETGAGPNGAKAAVDFTLADLARTTGDIVLARRHMGTSYHLSVVVDDAAQGVTHVVRVRIYSMLQKFMFCCNTF